MRRGCCRQVARDGSSKSFVGSPSEEMTTSANSDNALATKTDIVMQAQTAGTRKWYPGIASTQPTTRFSVADSYPISLSFIRCFG